MSEDAGTVLDACCVLNLYATGRMAEVLKALPGRFAVGKRAREEAQWLKAEDGDERELVDLAPLLGAGLVELLEIAEDAAAPTEIALFTTLAKQMEDGEAEAAALAIGRGYALATDERKVRRVLSTAHPTLTVVSTAELLYRWQDGLGLPAGEVGEVLRRVRRRATFAPPRSDLRRDWWIGTAG